MGNFLQKITSLVLLLFLFAFNLAIPLPAVEAEDTVISCSLKCGCPSAEKCCCCKKKINKVRNSEPGYPCFRDAGCTDIDAEGVICNALNHTAMISGKNLFVFRPAFYLAASSNILESAIFRKTIEKPPRPC